MSSFRAFSLAWVGSNFLVSASKSRLPSLVFTMAPWMLITPMWVVLAPAGAAVPTAEFAWAAATTANALVAARVMMTLRMVDKLMVLLSNSLKSARRLFFEDL